MPCTEFELLLAQQLDSPLTDAETTILRDHLAVCDDCRRLEQELLQINQDLFLLNLEPPADLDASIMAKIRAEASSTAPAATLASDKTKFRRWFSTAAAFFLVITATAIGSRILPIEHGIDAAPGTMGKAYQSASAPLQTSGGEDGSTQIPALKAAPDAEAPVVAPTGDSPEESPSYPTQRSANSTASTDAGGNPFSANNSMKDAADNETDVTAAGESAYGGSANTFAPESLMPPPSQEDVYTAAESPESEVTPPGDRGLPADTLLDAIAAELLLLEHLALPSSSPVTVTYTGLTPEEDAHLFLVTRTENIAETYSVDRIEGTVTLLPAPDSASPLTP